MKNCIEIDFFLVLIIHPPLPCYSGAFQKVYFPVSNFRCIWIFSEDILIFLIAIFHVGVFWFQKHIYVYVTGKMDPLGETDPPRRFRFA